MRRPLAPRWGVKRLANRSRIGENWALPVSNAERSNATMGDGVFLFSHAGACDLALS